MKKLIVILQLHRDSLFLILSLLQLLVGIVFFFVGIENLRNNTLGVGQSISGAILVGVGTLFLHKTLYNTNSEE